MCEPGQVLTCGVMTCSYNRQAECKAPTITVGGDHAKCDTFTTSEASIAEQEAMVVNCVQEDCAFNDDRMCEASGVTVSTHSEHADCMTYRAA